MLRILQVIPFFTPQMGGSAQVAYQVARQLGSLGHAVTVLTSDFGMQDSRFAEAPFDIVALPTLFSAGGFHFTPGLTPWAKKNIDKFDILHLHNFRTFQNIQVHPIARHFKKPYVLSAHGTLPIIVQRKTTKKIYDLFFGKRILQDAAACLAVSPVEVDQYRQFGIPQDKTELIFNGLDLGEFQDRPTLGGFRQEYFQTAALDTPLILYLGRIHRIKSIDILIRAFVIFQREYAHAQLAIVGPDEGEQAHLERLVADLQVKQVSFLGPLYGSRRLGALQDADMVVSPAGYEIFGLAPFEAILCGTPVVVSDDCGAGMLIRHAEIGYTSRIGDVDDLAQKMIAILASPEKAREKVDRGKAYIRENLDWHVLIPRLIRIYQNIM